MGAVTPSVNFTTRRLVLRRPELADAQSIFDNYAADASVTRFLSWRPHSDLQVTSSYLAHCLEAWNAGDDYAFAITKKENLEQVIGMISMRPKGHLVGFGYVLARADWGQGLMPEALTGLVDFALAQSAIWRAEAFCDVENKASARVMEKVGFSFEGRLQRYFVHPNIEDAPRDCYLYARIKDG